MRMTLMVWGLLSRDDYSKISWKWTTDLNYYYCYHYYYHHYYYYVLYIVRTSIYLASNLLTANSSQLEKIKYIYVYRSKQYITGTCKVTLIKNIFLSTNISIDAISSINLFLFGSIWFTIYHCFNRL